MLRAVLRRHLHVSTPSHSFSCLVSPRSKWSFLALSIVFTRLFTHIDPKLRSPLTWRSAQLEGGVLHNELRLSSAGSDSRLQRAGHTVTGQATRDESHLFIGDLTRLAQKLCALNVFVNRVQAVCLGPQCLCVTLREDRLRYIGSELFRSNASCPRKKLLPRLKLELTAVLLKNHRTMLQAYTLNSDVSNLNKTRTATTLQPCSKTTKR